MKNVKIAVWVVVAVVVVGLGALVLAPQSGVENVDGARMDELAAQGVHIVDVRTAGEYEVGHIAGAENVPMNELETWAASQDKSAPLAVYCATGSRSIEAVQYLQQAGFEKIYHFDAGLMAYAGDLETGGQAVAQAPVDETLETPVLYEFYTDWWPSCQAMAPIVDGLKGDYEGQVEFRLYDVEKDAEGSALMTRFGAQYVPTFVFVNSDGSVAAQIVGESTEDVMRQKLDALQ